MKSHGFTMTFAIINNTETVKLAHFLWLLTLVLLKISLYPKVIQILPPLFTFL